MLKGNQRQGGLGVCRYAVSFSVASVHHRSPIRASPPSPERRGPGLHSSLSYLLLISDSVTCENGSSSGAATLSMNGVNKALSTPSSLFGGLISTTEAGYSSNVDWSAAVSNRLKLCLRDNVRLWLWT